MECLRQQATAQRNDAEVWNDTDPDHFKSLAESYSHIKKTFHGILFLFRRPKEELFNFSCESRHARLSVLIFAIRLNEIPVSQSIVFTEVAPPGPSFLNGIVDFNKLGFILPPKER
jgi:hypothetical protein